MKPEQYKRAVQINDRICELETVKKEIKGNAKYRLWYAEKSERDWRLTSEWIMCYISEILDKHDKMIRQEIDDEIAALKAEIEVL